MKRSLLALAFVVAAAFTACWRTVEDAARQAYGFMSDSAVRVVTHVAGVFNARAEEFQRPDTPLVQSKAYASRIAKRERPIIFSNFRMCPSC